MHKDQEAKRCVRCILPEQYPRISFDEEGVCSYCRAYERRWRNWNPRDGEAEFLRFVESARKRNPKYSAVVGISGGKDSTYTLHMLVKHYGLNVIAFTYDNGFFPSGAKENIDKIVKKLNVEHRYIGIDKDVERRMYKAIFKKRSADFCQICMLGALSAANYLAEIEKIPMIVWGISQRTESITPPEYFLANDYRYLVDVVEPDVNRSEFPLFKYADIPRILKLMFIKRVSHVFLPQYIDWDEKEISEFIEKEYAWVDYGGGASHFDCIANAAVDFFTRQRTGVSKVTEKLSQLVRSGQLTRDEALEKLHVQDQVEEPVESVNGVCQSLGVDREDLRAMLEGNTLDYRHFKSYSKYIGRFSWILWITYKLGLTAEGLYQKYSTKRS